MPFVTRNPNNCSNCAYNTSDNKCWLTENITDYYEAKLCNIDKCQHHHYNISESK